MKRKNFSGMLAFNRNGRRGKPSGIAWTEAGQACIFAAQNLFKS